MPKIILATASPYRQKAFRLLDLEFVSESSDIDEDFDGRPHDPRELVAGLNK